MEVLEWLNENALRGYPLLEEASKWSTSSPATALPDNFLLDLVLVSSSPLTQATTLTEVAVMAPRSLVVTFSTGDQFHIADTAAEAYPAYIRLESGSLAVIGEGAKAFTAGTYTYAIPVEPCTVFEFCNEWLGVSSIDISPAIATYDSVGYAPKTLSMLGLQTTDTPPLTGNVRVRAGYNFRIGISGNLIDLQAAAGLGLKLSCTTSFIADALKDCAQIVSYINGIPPAADNKFSLVAGTNINIIDGITVEPAQYDQYDAGASLENSNLHTLFVGLTFLQTDLCSPVNLTPEVNA